MFLLLFDHLLPVQMLPFELVRHVLAQRYLFAGFNFVVVPDSLLQMLKRGELLVGRHHEFDLLLHRIRPRPAVPLAKQQHNGRIIEQVLRLVHELNGNLRIILYSKLRQSLLLVFVAVYLPKAILMLFSQPHARNVHLCVLKVIHRKHKHSQLVELELTVNIEVSDELAVPGDPGGGEVDD